MARNVKKYIEDYNKKYVANNNDQFLVSDIMQLQEITKKDDAYIFNLISNALNFGSMIGRESTQKEGA